MRVEIKEVRACKNGAYGNFLLRGGKSVLITLSLKRNPRVLDYATTMLHELLHLWVTLLRLKGIRTTNVREHKFIYAVEKAITSRAARHLRRRK